MLTPSAIPVSSSSVPSAIEVTVASLANPAAELALIGTAVPQWAVCKTVAAGTDDATWYRLDATSGATNVPYVVASLTAGLKWVAVAGAYANALEVQDGTFAIAGSADRTKTIKFEVDAQTTADDLTINSGAQTDDRTATFPVLTGNSILVLSNSTLTSGRVPFATTNGIITDSASLTWNGSTLSVAGALTVTATNVIGGSFSATSTDINGAYALDFIRTANTTASGGHNARAVSGRINGAIASGQTNSGNWAGLWAECLRNYVSTGDTGTLATLEGARISIGHFVTDASTPTTTTMKGLYVIGYRSTGTIGTQYGFHLDLNGTTGVTPTLTYGIKLENIAGTTAYAIHTGTGLVSFGDEVLTVASSTTRAGLNIPHGSAPSSPVNGDMWTTTAGLFVRINGATIGPLS
jgi:hypothetical protein